MARKISEPEFIFGVLCDSAPLAPAGTERMLRKRLPGAVLLPFQVGPRHIKNVVKCMLLMDVMGLVVLGSHRKRIMPHVSKLDKSALKAGMADIVVRRGRSFKAYCAAQIARDQFRKDMQGDASPKTARRAAPLLAKKTQRISVELLTPPDLLK